MSAANHEHVREFGRLVLAEWTKFRTVRGWVLGTVAATAVTVLLGPFVASNSLSSCSNGTVDVECPTPPVGPNGESVRDKFFFVHKTLTGDGAITARVTSMTGVITYPPPNHDEIVPGLAEWAKAGVIAKDGTEEGSRYVALMATAKHGVRMQHDFVHDTAGKPGAVSTDAPRWLRLTRVGETLTGEESTDGTTWTMVGTAKLAGTVELGLFVTSPSDLTVDDSAGGGAVQARLTKATATFDHVGLTGAAPGSDWLRHDVGAEPNPDGSPHHPGGEGSRARRRHLPRRDGRRRAGHPARLGGAAGQRLPAAGAAAVDRPCSAARSCRRTGRRPGRGRPR